MYQQNDIKPYNLNSKLRVMAWKIYTYLPTYKILHYNKITLI